MSSIGTVSVRCPAQAFCLGTSVPNHVSREGAAKEIKLWGESVRTNSFTHSKSNVSESPFAQIHSLIFTYQSPLAHKTCLGRLGKPVHGDSFRRARGRQGQTKASRSTRGSRLMDQSFGASLTRQTTPSRRICRSDGVSAFRPLRLSFPDCTGPTSSGRSSSLRRSWRRLPEGLAQGLLRILCHFSLPRQLHQGRMCRSHWARSGSVRGHWLLWAGAIGIGAFHDRTAVARRWRSR